MSTHWVLTTEGYPPERHNVLVALRVEDGQQIDLIALGYMRYAGGVKECPFFVTPSGRGVAYAWCDCLPAEMTTARFEPWNTLRELYKKIAPPREKP